MANFEDYVYDGGNVLKNKFGITDLKKLKLVEEEIVFKKIFNLSINPIDGNFDSLHLKKIHTYLFEDIYEFAGKWRDVTMFKEQTSYLNYEDIEKMLPLVLSKYNNMKIPEISLFEKGLFLANFYKDIIYIHPFRDGNSRTTREFLREFVLKKMPGYELDYSKMDKNNFKLALKESDVYSINTLAYEFYKALVKINQKEK